MTPTSPAVICSIGPKSLELITLAYIPIVSICPVTSASDPNLEGFYAYLDSWAVLSFGFTVEIDNTNSVGSGSCPSPLSGGWIFRNSENLAASQAFECLVPGFNESYTTSNPDTRGYVFTIV